jgi:DNA-binding response OmpR family regulator
MVVDDDEDVRTLLSDILSKSSYAVTEVPDGASLEEAFTGPQPDVVLLDLKLPDADGLDLLPKIKR